MSAACRCTRLAARSPADRRIRTWHGAATRDQTHGTSVVSGGISETLNAGDSLFFQADADHGFANRTNAPCEYIMVISRRT
ncbi:cupin domain-containing protein [Nonomuraea pusilla]|uniref:cupin domain-containing protein n=1 Tax=Nonomuraea pusilla TaxID=46177 RepID=UPI003333E1C7